LGTAARTHLSKFPLALLLGLRPLPPLLRRCPNKQFGLGRHLYIPCRFMPEESLQMKHTSVIHEAVYRPKARPASRGGCLWTPQLPAQPSEQPAQHNQAILPACLPACLPPSLLSIIRFVLPGVEGENPAQVRKCPTIV